MNKTYLFEVFESGYERHDGEFYKSFLLTDKLQDALKKYNEILNSVKKENDFFLRNHINEAQEGTHTPSAYDYSINLPFFEIKPEDSDERYELCISCIETDICEEKTKLYAILINKQDYIDTEDQINSWVDFHEQLFNSEEDANEQLNELIKQEFADLCINRGNETDYHLDNDEKTIYDSETGVDIPVAHYHIIQFENSEKFIDSAISEEEYDNFVDEFINKTPIQKSLRLARGIILHLADVIKTQWLECNPEESEETFFDENYEDLQHSAIVLEEYIH